MIPGLINQIRRMCHTQQFTMAEIAASCAGRLSSQAVRRPRCGRNQECMSQAAVAGPVTALTAEGIGGFGDMIRVPGTLDN
ncbi:hypothetical protein ABH924_004814 [Arthrobacter sp. GAS37]